MNKIIEKIKLFFSTTKLGHFIKSAFVTFTGIFIGMLILTPAWNTLTGSALPTIQQFKDLWPVVLDSFYRALWAFFLLQIGVYKYSSSTVETTKPVITPNKDNAINNS
jgi:flagellar biosynthesis protein FlhB